MKTPNTICFLLLGLLLVTACGKEDDHAPNQYSTEEYAIIQEYLNLPKEVLNYRQKEENPYGATSDFHITQQSLALNYNHSATLGRVLFYDESLSNAGKSCASCHQPAYGFGDNKAFSTGYNGAEGRRNTPALINLRFRFGNLLGWTGRFTDFEDQYQSCLEDASRMNTLFFNFLAKARKREYYPILFEKAFGSDDFSKGRFSSAITVFLYANYPYSTEFDPARIANNGNMFPDYAEFSMAQNAGKALYMAKCASCHGQFMYEPEYNLGNNGLDLVSEDAGAAIWSGNDFDEGRFRIPTLRNLAFTAPYMHDGRFPDLESVLAHYSEGIQAHANLQALLIDPTTDLPKRFELTEEEQINLLSFLQTLNQEKITEELRFAPVFK